MTLSHLHEAQWNSVLLAEVSDSTTDIDMFTQQYRYQCLSIPYVKLMIVKVASALITCLHIQSQEQKDNGTECQYIVDTSSRPVSVHMTRCRHHLPVSQLNCISLKHRSHSLPLYYFQTILQLLHTVTHTTILQLSGLCPGHLGELVPSSAFSGVK